MDVGLSTPDWQFVLPIAPEAVDVQYESVLVPWTSIRDGLVKVPAGRQPRAVSFKVLLPSETTLAQLYPDKAFVDEATFDGLNTVRAGGAASTAFATDPLVYVANLEQALDQNKSLVYLLCDELKAANTYLVEKVAAHHAGAFGDIELSLSLSEYRVPRVTTTSGPIGFSGGQAIQGPPAPAHLPNADQADGNPRLSQPYTTQPGDTLFTIASRVTPVNDPGDFAQQIWDYAQNGVAITNAGGGRDGSLPPGIILIIPPSIT